METWILSGLWSTVLQIQWFVDFLGGGHTVLWTRKTMSNNSSIVGEKLWWDPTVCRSVWRITNAVFQAWAVLQLDRLICDLCGRFLIDLCHRSFEGCAVVAAAVVTNWISRISDAVVECWRPLNLIFSFSGTSVCHPPNFKQTVTDMTASSVNGIIFADRVWHDPAQNDLKFKVNSFRGGGGGREGGSLSGEMRTVDGNLLPVKAC